MNKTATAVLLIAATILLQSFSFLAIKFAAITHGDNVWLYLSVAFTMILGRAWLWQIVLKYISLSIIYAVVFFNEHIIIDHLLGLILMLGGLFMITKSH